MSHVQSLKISRNAQAQMLVVTQEEYSHFVDWDKIQIQRNVAM